MRWAPRARARRPVGASGAERGTPCTRMANASPEPTGPPHTASSPGADTRRAWPMLQPGAWPASRASLAVVRRAWAPLSPRTTT